MLFRSTAQKDFNDFAEAWVTTQETGTEVQAGLTAALTHIINTSYRPEDEPVVSLLDLLPTE